MTFHGMWPSRVVGSVLLLLSVAPLHRLLVPQRAGPAGEAVRASAEAAWLSGLLGGAMVLVIAFLLSRIGPTGALRSAVARTSGRGARLPPRRDHAPVAALAGLIAALVALGVHGGLPTSVDEMVQLLHAATLAGGRLGLPLDLPTAAIATQNGLLTPEGWVSIYPPAHTLLLAAGVAMGAAWLLGPLAVAVATWAVSSSLDELLEDLRVARTAGLILAVSPFWILLGATHLSHTTAAAGLALVLRTALTAVRGGMPAAALLGASIGVAVSARPWTGLVGSVAIVLAVALTRVRSGGEEAEGGGAVGRLAAVVAGGAPFALLLFWWNARLFGSPFRLGYASAFGPGHGLGLHTDPWGNAYGLREAIAYTGADVTQLGAHLFESPFPAVALLAAALLLRTAPRGVAVLLAWALAALGANALYWHHGVHMGPRMLFESVPAWVTLTVWGGHALAREGPDAQLRDVAVWTAGLALVGSLLLAPPYLLAHRAGAGAAELASLPAPPSATATVFVHGSWASRISARLADAGMRRDSIETALRRNDVCRVDRYARARLAGTRTDDLDFEPRPGTAGHLSRRTLSPGNSVRVDPAEPVTPSCQREAASDRLGSIELELLLWRAPPLAEAQLLLVRDMGPEENEGVLARGTGTPWVWLDGEEGPRLLPYEEGMALLWGQ